MILASSITIAVLFGAGASLLVSRDLIRVAAGTSLVSNAAFLYVFSAALARGRAPILPLPRAAEATDPLVQALTLTAIVISFGVTALMLALAARLHSSHGTADLQRIAEMEMQESTNEGRA